MKKIYINKIYFHIVTVLVLLLASSSVSAQVVKAFTQRTSPYAPSQYKKDASGKVYNLRGDFSMLGNSNLTMNPYSNTAGNNSNMVYVDIDGDGNTVNSSSAVLNIPDDNCTEIVYAGLYWSGRLHDGATSSDTKVVTKSVPSGNVTQTQTLDHSHNGTNNLDNTAVSIQREGSTNVFYSIQTVTIGNVTVEFTILNNGTISVRQRTGTGNWSNSTNLSVTLDNSSVTDSYNPTDSSTSDWTLTSSDNSGGTCYRYYSRTQTLTKSGRRLFQLNSAYVVTYNNVTYKISKLASYFREVSTRTQTAQRSKVSNNCGSNFGYGNHLITNSTAWASPVYNATLAEFTTATNNYVTIEGPKTTATGSTTNTWTLDKHIIKFKKEGQAYTSFTASDTDISYPNGNYANMYAAYKDVTEYVRLHGVGNYFAADLATAEGDGGGTGFYGGWGLIVVYANPNMKWRDVTIFDGYAYVVGGTAQHDLPISGFESAQNGPVNVTFGFMAGEGDVSIENDYLRVIKKNGNVGTASDWVNLGNTGSAGGAFFSNISTGNNTRNPNLVNNASFDIQKFDLPNQAGGSNVIIGNSQTSTTFRYGSDQDTYIIYNMVFAVDAYVPEVEGVNQVLTAATSADINNLQPGDEVTYTLDVYNYGSDIIDNGKIDVDIPYAMKVVSYSMQQNTQTASGANQAFSFSQPQWVNPETNSASSIQPATIDGGIIRWNLGTIPTQTPVININNRVAMAKLTYTLKVTDNCTVLQTSKDECALKPEINGTITGLGRNSGENLSTEFIKGYNTDCNNTPIFGGIDMQINPSEAFLTQCSLDEPIQGETRIFRKFCQVANNEIIRNEITSQYIAGTKFYSMLPTDANATVLTGNFPVNPNGAQTMYYAVLPGANQACFYQLATQLDVINQAPSVSNVDVCYGVTYILNPIVPSFVVENAPSYYYFENGSTTPSIPFVQPIKPGVYTYQVALGKEENGVYCFGPKSSFTITIRNCQTPVNPMIYTPLNR